MHIHLLGICGTFMGGIALIARSLGHNVTGSDENIYPPMSTLLTEQQIKIIQGYDPKQLEPHPDLIIVGNAMSRGNPCVEAMLEQNIPYQSAPQWLHDNVLSKKWVLAVAGTHGKTTTAGMLAWILEYCGYNPSFVIGGVPGNFNVSARLTDSRYFVIEADEYDTAFFDKRSKFVHYCPRTLIINNLEFDHADIFDDLHAIQRQFHHLIRLIPGKGRIIYPANDNNIKQTLTLGCWSEQEPIGSDNDSWKAVKRKNDASEFDVYYQAKPAGQVKWALVGNHNMNNALAAIAAAWHIGIAPEQACKALNAFINARRRLELFATINHINLYDDFAHHPTAISSTLEALRSKIGDNSRILAVLEPRSNTMKLGVHKNDIASALKQADEVFIFQPADINWQVTDIVKECKQPTHWSANFDQLIEQIIAICQPDDSILIMSNGSFSGIHKKLISRLTEQTEKQRS